MTIFSIIIPKENSNAKQNIPDIKIVIHLNEELLNINGDIFEYWTN